MSIALDTELVDFGALQQDGSGIRAHTLLRNVAQLFVMTADRCADEQLQTYDSVLGRLADLVESEARAALAAMLAPLTRAPQGVLSRLAADEIAVARPLLSESPALSDAVLMDVAQTKSHEHRLAISKRAELSEAVTDLLISFGEMPVLRRIGANKGARISRGGFDRLLEFAGGDVVLHEKLSARDDLPNLLLQALVEQAGETVRGRLVAAGRIGEVERIGEASGIARQRIERAITERATDFAAARDAVAKLAAERGIGEEDLRRYAERDAYAETVCAFSLLSGVPLAQAQRWLSEEAVGHVLIAARALDFKPETVRALLACGPWRASLTRVSREQAMERFTRLPADQAARIFRVWRTGKHAN